MKISKLLYTIIFEDSSLDVDRFIVDVWYNPEEICIDKIRSFKSRRCLEPYLERIELDF